MTEEKAKKKWCPYYRNSVSREGSAYAELSNRDINIVQGFDRVFCVADQCMAWRWNIYLPAVLNNEKSTAVSVPIYENSKTDGYCGMGK